ncbi:hypothetical protein G6F68_017948 [Rhizopus microsporus]|nr:hypothetical protein G6F68_017948 [Rhizopus microsporus]
MTTNKNRRGRPKRANSILQKEKQANGSILSQSRYPDLDIKQPLIIHKVQPEVLEIGSPVFVTPPPSFEENQMLEKAQEERNKEKAHETQHLRQVDHSRLPKQT